MLGSYAVGKTSLVRRFVHSIFSDKYLTTIGVKVDIKTVTLSEREVQLLLWDIHGDDDFQKVRASYLKGMSGYLLVADGTRAATLDVVEPLRTLVKETVGDVPFILLVNKADLGDEWEIPPIRLKKYEEQGWKVMRTSAKTGEQVEEAFLALTKDMLA